MLFSTQRKEIACRNLVSNCEQSELNFAGDFYQLIWMGDKKKIHSEVFHLARRFQIRPEFLGL